MREQRALLFFQKVTGLITPFNLILFKLYEQLIWLHLGMILSSSNSHMAVSRDGTLSFA